MINYFHKIKRWYGFREFREKLLFIGLCWALIYAVFSFAVFTPLDKKAQTLRLDIDTASTQIQSWTVQIDAVNQIPKSQLYKKWQLQQSAFDTKRKAYHSLLLSTSAVNWEEVIKSILYSDTAITIAQIKNSPEEPYVIPGVQSSIPIYNQKLSLVIYSNYFDTIAYIKKLQDMLPTIRWDSMKYEVVKYPLAKIEMGFAVIYEKDK